MKKSRRTHRIDFGIFYSANLSLLAEITGDFSFLLFGGKMSSEMSSDFYSMKHVFLEELLIFFEYCLVKLKQRTRLGPWTLSINSKWNVLFLHSHLERPFWDMPEVEMIFLIQGIKECLRWRDLSWPSSPETANYRWGPNPAWTCFGKYIFFGIEPSVLSMATFPLHQQNEVVATQTVWPTKHKVCTIWPFPDGCADPSSPTWACPLGLRGSAGTLPGTGASATQGPPVSSLDSCEC